jgi:hypothetical protein
LAARPHHFFIIPDTEAFSSFVVRSRVALSSCRGPIVHVRHHPTPSGFLFFVDQHLAQTKPPQSAVKSASINFISLENQYARLTKQIF